MKNTIRRGGYFGVSLQHGDRRTTASIHRLVADAFCERVEGKDVVNHLDGDKHHNVAGNLEWTDREGNEAHALANGLKAHPRQVPAKVVAWVIRMWLEGIRPQQVIADKVGVWQATVSRILRRAELI